LFGGQLQALFPTIPGAIEHIRAGRLRQLAVTASTRAQVLPQITRLGEFIPGFATTPDPLEFLGAPENPRAAGEGLWRPRVYRQTTGPFDCRIERSVLNQWPRDHRLRCASRRDANVPPVELDQIGNYAIAKINEAVTR
jgi:hypothetical protein